MTADASISRDTSHQCLWDPPNNSATDNFLYALYTMPDCCYIFCPVVLPTDASTMPMAGMSIESGCMSSHDSFQRTILRYTQDGSLSQMQHEKYKRCSAQF